MTTENWVVQVSVKLPHDAQDNYRDTLVNVRAETTEQLASVMGWLENHATELASTIQTIRGAAVVGTIFPGAGTGAVQVAPAPQFPPQDQFQAPPQQQYQQQAPQQYAQQGPPPVMCAHGPMAFKSGTKKDGSRWSAHFCSLPKGSPGACEPQWGRG